MSNGSHDGYYEVFWPRASRATRLKSLAKRLDSLDGRTVAQLWDFVFRGDEVFELLEEGLKARFPGIRFVSWRVFGTLHSSKERETLASLPRRLKELGVDAAISGMGC